MPIPSAALFRPLLLSAGLGMLPALAAPCDNVVKPFQVGWVWSYRTVQTTALTAASADVQAVSAYQVQSRVAEGGYEDVYTAGGKTQGTFRFRCVQGALTVVSLPSVAGVEISRSAVTGVSLPAAADWKPGLSWTQVWTLAGRRGLLSGTAVVSSRSQVLGRESVTVSAGTFMAWKVSIKTVLDAKMGFVPLHQDFPEQIQWYAENVGLVRTEDTKGRTELLRLQK